MRNRFFRCGKPEKLSAKLESIMAIFIACLLSLMLLPGCVSKASQPEPVHLLIKVPRTGHDVVFDDSISQVHQVIEKMADAFEADYDGVPVDIEVEVFEQNQYDSAVEEAIGGEESPDILYGDYFNISTYIHTGHVVPLDDLVTDDISEDIYSYLWDMSSVDNRIYMMPYLARQNVLAYNKALFVEAGLEEYIEDGVIQSWTLDEWTEILDTLAANLPEDTFPMMMYAGSSQGDTHTMTLLRCAGSDFFDEGGDFNLSAPEGVKALEWIQQGVAKGWFPPHCENLEIEDCSSLFRNGQLAIYMVNNASIERYGDTVGFVNFPGPDEAGCATTFVSGFEVFDNGDSQRLKVAKDFISYVYGNEDLLSYAAGTLPASKKVSEKYKDDISGYEMFDKNRENVVDFTNNNPDTRAVREIFYKCIHELLMGNMTPSQAAERIDAQCNEAIDNGRANSVLHD